MSRAAPVGMVDVTVDPQIVVEGGRLRYVELELADTTVTPA